MIDPAWVQVRATAHGVLLRRCSNRSAQLQGSGPSRGRRGSGPTAPCPFGRSGVLPLQGCRAWGDHAAGAARPHLASLQRGECASARVRRSPCSP